MLQRDPPWFLPEAFGDRICRTSCWNDISDGTSWRAVLSSSSFEHATESSSRLMGRAMRKRSTPVPLPTVHFGGAQTANMIFEHVPVPAGAGLLFGRPIA